MRLGDDYASRLSGLKDKLVCHLKLAADMVGVASGNMFNVSLKNRTET